MQTGANIQIEGSASDGGCQLLGCSQGSHTPLRPPPSPQPRGDKVPMGQENKTGVSPCRENPNLRLGDPNSAPTLHGHNPPPLPPGLLCPPSLLWGGTQRPHPLQLPQPCPVLPSPHPLPHICSPMFPALTSPPLCLLPRVPFPTSPALCLQSQRPLPHVLFFLSPSLCLLPCVPHPLPHVPCSVLFPTSSSLPTFTSPYPLPYVCCCLQSRVPCPMFPSPYPPPVSSSPRTLPRVSCPISPAPSPMCLAPYPLPFLQPHISCPMSPSLCL